MIHTANTNRLIRVSGIVRLASRVRQALALPQSAAQIAAMRASVQSQLEQLAEYFATEGVSSDDLPLPSQRALQFLQAVPWDQAAERATAGPGTRAVPTLRAPALSAYAKRMQRILAEPSTAGSIDALRKSLQTNLSQFDAALRSAGQTPDALKKNARSDLAWVSLLASEDFLEKYLSAVTTATAIFQRIAPAAGCRLPVRVHFVPLAGIFRFRSSPRGTAVMLPMGMIAFDAADFEDLAAFSLGRDRARRQSVLQRIEAVPYQHLQARFDLLSGNVGQHLGAFHDLNASFDRVNSRYFDGSMPRPRLTWGSAFTTRKLGHYQRTNDTVQISASMDQQHVPQLALDFLMYHELLHKKHQTKWKAGRGYAHTPAFRQDERQFEGYEEAEKMLHEIARGATID